MRKSISVYDKKIIVSNYIKLSITNKLNHFNVQYVERSFRLLF